VFLSALWAGNGLASGFAGSLLCCAAQVDTGVRALRHL